MGAENKFSITHPQLSKTSGEILANAIKHSADQGNNLATVESLFVSLVSHRRIAPIARMVGIEPDFLDLARGTRPVAEGAAMLWDGEVQIVIHLAHIRALNRGARRAGVVDLLEVTTQHEAVRDLFSLSPDRLGDIDRLERVLVKGQTSKPDMKLAS